MRIVSFTGIKTEYNGEKIELPLICFEVKGLQKNKPFNLHFYLDTGSNGSMIFSHSVKIIEPNWLFPDDEKSQEISIHSFNDFAIDKKLKIRIDRDARLSESFEEPVVTGIIGTDFLSAYSISIDFSVSNFQLLTNNSIIYQHKCRYAFENNFLFLYALIDNVELKFLYDTGTGGSIALFERGFDKLDREKYTRENDIQADGAFGTVYNFDTYKENINLTFSDELVFDTEFAVLQNNSMTDSVKCDGILGNQLFLNRAICINYLSQEFSFSELK